LGAEIDFVEKGIKEMGQKGIQGSPRKNSLNTREFREGNFLAGRRKGHSLPLKRRRTLS
jgi:hypothetical protein